MSTKLIISYDFGTSSVKAALFDDNGNIVADSSCNYPLYIPQAGWAEQNPSEWWKAMRSVTARLMSISGQPASSINAISICAQMCGVLPVDTNGVPLSNCLIWLDMRSGEIARRITDGYLKISGYGLFPLLRWLRYTNGAPNLSGRDPVSKILWLKECRSELWNNTAKILDVKDYLVYCCCKRFITTPDCAHLTWLMDSRPDKICWSENLLTLLDIDRKVLPEICRPDEIAGKLDKESAIYLGLNAGIPVISGAGDLVASALGAGSLLESEPHIHIGSSSWLGVHLSNRKVDVINGIGTICSAEINRYLLVAAQQTGAMCLDWACKIFGITGHDNRPDYARFNSMAAESPAGSRGLIFLPWLLGECVPKNIPPGSAGFINLHCEHELQDIFRSIMEGVAMNILWAYKAIYKHMKNIDNIRFFGGGAYSDIWCQILADVIDLPLKRIDKPHLTGVRGAAMLASTALGWQNNLTDAAKTARINKEYYPDPNNSECYKQQFNKYLGYYKSNKSTYYKN